MLLKPFVEGPYPQQCLRLLQQHPLECIQALLLEKGGLLGEEHKTVNWGQEAPKFPKESQYF